ncbi:MAG TPA: ferredoxin [Chloroflexia bacterium]|nr:ferredoxin [Chloroflexia bacterium]
MTYIVSIDQSRCIGAGNCVHIAPTVFQLDEENIAYLLDPGSVDDETLLDAARSCPTNAIYLDTEDGQAVYP